MPRLRREPGLLATAAGTAVLVVAAIALVVSQGRLDGPAPTVSPTPTVAAAIARPDPGSVDVPAPPPPATPTPTPDPAVWRYEGVVVDDAGKPLAGVCVWIGPNGCRPFSPRTDERGVYFFDVPQNAAIFYDITFEIPGHVTRQHRARPAGPTIFNVVMQRSSR